MRLEQCICITPSTGLSLGPFEKKRNDLEGTLVKNRDGEAGIEIKFWKNFEQSRVLDYGEGGSWMGDDIDEAADEDIEGL